MSLTRDLTPLSSLSPSCSTSDDPLRCTHPPLTTHNLSYCSIRHPPALHGDYSSSPIPSYPDVITSSSLHNHHNPPFIPLRPSIIPTSEACRVLTLPHIPIKGSLHANDDISRSTGVPEGSGDIKVETHGSPLFPTDLHSNLLRYDHFCPCDFQRSTSRRPRPTRVSKHSG